MRQETEGMGLLTLKCVRMNVYIYIYAHNVTTDCMWWETSSHFTSQDTICNILFVTAFTRTNQWCCSEPNAEVKNSQLYFHSP